MKTNETLKLNWFEKQSELFEESRFGAMALMMTAQSCLGSIAAMYTLINNNVFLLSICATVTMISNTAFIAQSPPKWCLAIFYISVVANSLILLLSMFILN